MARLRGRDVNVSLRWSVCLAAAIVFLVCAPSVLAAPKTLQGAAYEQMKLFMQDFDKDGFAKVTDLGAANTYKATLAGLTLAVDPTLKGVAQYDPKTKTLTFSKDPRKVTGAARIAMGETVWHEVTHAIEDARGDIGYFDSEAYAERNVDYMTSVARGALPWLEQLEKQAKNGASVEKLKAIWQKYLKAMDAAAKLPSTTRYPPDLGLMKTWFGFDVDPADVKAAYLSGKAFSGKKWENLRLALQAPFKSEDWAGYWRSTGASDDNLTLTVSGASVAGVFAAPWRADYSDFQGTISADGGSMTGTWLYTPPGKPTPPVQVFAFTFFLNFNRYGDGLWRLQGYFTTPSAPGEQNWIGYFK
jgi:hypothetical protein